MLRELGASCTAPPDELIQRAPAYNAAPMQQAPVVTADESGVLAIQSYRWGWRGERGLHINARSETAMQKPAFREAWQQRHCLVIADGFYEWQVSCKEKLPWRFVLDEVESPMVIAGLWQPDGPSYAVLTTKPNDTVASVHDRMPVILPPENWLPWINGPAETWSKICSPCAAPMHGFRVTPQMNSWRFTGPECVQPWTVEADLFG